MRHEEGKRPKDASGEGSDKQGQRHSPFQAQGEKGNLGDEPLTISTDGPFVPQGRVGQFPMASPPSCLPTLPGLYAEGL